MPELQKKTLEALNDHVQQEMQSSHEYLAASAHFSMEGLQGMASWMRLQADEENLHARKFYDHILDRGGRVHLKEIPEPPSDYKGPTDVFSQALEREKRTTKHIDRLYEFAVEQKDFALQIFLQWFIEEQVKEEEGLRHILQRLDLIGKDKAALVMLDRELGSRGPGLS